MNALIEELNKLEHHNSTVGCRCFDEPVLEAAGIDIAEADHALDSDVIQSPPVVDRSLKGGQMVPGYVETFQAYLAVPERLFAGDQSG